jgi:hypothetical protein
MSDSQEHNVTEAAALAIRQAAARQAAAKLAEVCGITVDELMSRNPEP